MKLLAGILISLVIAVVTVTGAVTFLLFIFARGSKKDEPSEIPPYDPNDTRPEKKLPWHIWPQ